MQRLASCRSWDAVFERRRICGYASALYRSEALIKRGMYVIAVPDLERSAAFYRDALGFEIEEIGDPGWRMYARDGCRIMAGECPDALPPVDLGDHSYYAYLVVDDVEPYYERAKAHGAEILKQPRAEPWRMLEFAVRTVDGHRIMIGQEMDEPAGDGRR